MPLESFASDLLGDTIVEDREFFGHALAMLYRCAYYLDGGPPANIFCLLGWACWMTGRGSEVQNFLIKAEVAYSGHRLSELLNTLITQGKAPAAALNYPES